MRRYFTDPLKTRRLWPLRLRYHHPSFVLGMLLGISHGWRIRRTYSEVRQLWD